MATLKQIYLDVLRRRVFDEFSSAEQKAIAHNPSYCIDLARAREEADRYLRAIDQAYERSPYDPAQAGLDAALASAEHIAKAGLSWAVLSPIERAMEVNKVQRILRNAYAAGYSIIPPEK